MFHPEQTQEEMNIYGYNCYSAPDKCTSENLRLVSAVYLETLQDGNHMAYTAIEQMRQQNLQTYGVDAGPAQPILNDPDGNDLKSAALRFLHERCEDLLFDPEITREEQERGVFAGTSQTSEQIPYNMQMDINRLCLERELEQFIDSGNANEAYAVYYCFFEIYLGRYGKSKRMIELLSEFEANGSSLLMKHRDHYSHSVYVFTLGLAIYETNLHFRRAFKSFYEFSTDENDKEADRRAAHMFLAYWGLTALFHDIGYPFELPFEQVKSYFTVTGTKRSSDTPYLIYKNIDPLIAFNDAEKKHFHELYHKDFSTLEELFAFVITNYLGEAYEFSEGYLYNVIHKKPVHPELLKFKMDHAYFSAVRLYQELISSPLGAAVIRKPHMDALTAILLHNYIYKNSISFCTAEEKKRKEPLRMERFPLAYLLFLCDELQCWDRTAYGRNSRLEIHPISVDMDFSNGELRAKYIYDREEQEKVDKFKLDYKAWEESGEPGEPPCLKEYSDMSEKEKRFQREIEAIVNTENIPLTISVEMRDADRKRKHTYLSVSNFLHLYDFAVALNGRYSHQDTEEQVPTEQLEAEFEALSLEYQLSNINQAKSFAKYLNAINCFYTDKPVDFDMLTAFTEQQVDIIAPMEHERWMNEKADMAWQPGSLYQTISLDKVPFAASYNEKSVRKMLREQFRMHELVLPGKPDFEEVREHYLQLVEAEKEKDFLPFNSMLKLIKKFDGLRIYQLYG